MKQSIPSAYIQNGVTGNGFGVSSKPGDVREDFFRGPHSSLTLGNLYATTSLRTRVVLLLVAVYGNGEGFHFLAKFQPFVGVPPSPMLYRYLVYLSDRRV